MYYRILDWLDDFVLWVKVKNYKWKHRHDTPEQRKQAHQQSVDDLKEAWQNVKTEFDDMPATKEVHEAYEVMDDLLEDLSVK